MKKWLKISKEILSEIQRSVSSCVGTSEAGEVLCMGADGTPTMRIDDLAEHVVLEYLEKRNLDAWILSEELGLKKGDNDIIIVIDPLDGTDNAIKGIPMFSSSVAVGKIENSNINLITGAVRNLVTGDIFEAIKGHGAYLNGRKIRASRTENLEDACLGLYIYGFDLDTVKNLCSSVKRSRLFGSIALELCFVANSSYDIFVDIRGSARITDLAAGIVIVEEAGGIVTDHRGNPIIPTFDINTGTSVFAAGNRVLLQKAMEKVMIND
ncbi:MAG: bifunctional fructose-bisphosphatase/inositol-phosphate phosphatase [Candidatus Hydrothermarchaeota archaeon]